MKVLFRYVLFSTFCFSTFTHSAIITLNVEGYIDYFSSPTVGITGTNLQQNDLFSGNLTYDTDVVLNSISNFPLGNLYSYSASNFSASLTFFNPNGNLSLDISGTSSIDLYDDFCCNQSNMYFGRTFQNWSVNASGLTGTTTIERVNAFRMAKDNSQFDFSQNPPPIPVSFDYDRVRDGSATNGFYIVFDDGNGNSPVAYTRFSKITNGSSVSVPEPFSLILLSVGLSFITRNQVIRRKKYNTCERDYF